MSLGILTSSLRVLKNLDLQKIEYDRLLGLIPTRVGSEDGTYGHLRERRTRLQLVMISTAVCGIEFCYAAETAFVSPTLLKIGVPVVYMTLIWCLSPLIGFLLVPVLGSLSDRCRMALGRRRPFILLLSVGIIFGLILVPNGRSIGEQLGDVYTHAGDNTSDLQLPTRYLNTWNVSSMRNKTDTVRETRHHPHPWSILFTVLGVVLLDFSCDACQSPCRAFMLDVCLPEDHPAGLTTFTILAGLGGALGYLMGGIDWSQTAIGESLGGHVKVVFTIVLFIYLMCLIVTIMSVKEIPLGKLGLSEEDFQTEKKKVKKCKYRRFTNETDDEDEDSERGEKEEMKTKNGGLPDYGSNFRDNVSNTPTYNDKETDKTKHKTTHSLSPPEHSSGNSNSNSDVESSNLKRGSPIPSEISLKTYLKSIVRMPRSLAVLCVTNLFCWMSLVCYSLYFTDFVGQAIYGGDPLAPRGSYSHKRYEAGVRLGSFGMALYSISCSFYSLSIERLVKRFRKFHAIL